MIHFPPFALDIGEAQLWKGKQLVALRRKPFAILRYLAENPGKLVTHDDLLANVWAGAVVSDSSLRTHLHDLRAVLGDGVIETVVGRGYRFIAKLEHAGVPAPAIATRTVVGRTHELAVLDAALERALAGHRQICFVTGEPGIGKTTLVDAFLDTLPARKIASVRGHCIEQYGTPESYLAVIEMLGRLRFADRGEHQIATLVRHAPSFVVQVPHLISDAQLADATRRTGAGAESRTMRELVQAIEALATEPLVIVLEDLQWSDVATIDLVSLLGQRKELAKLLVIATSRRAESQTITHPLNRVMRNLVARNGAIAIPLERIEQTDMRQFLDLRFPAHEFPDSFLDLLERITAGTPLFLVSILDDLVERKLIDHEAGVWSLARASEEIAAYRPATVRQLIDIQLDRLETQEQRVLEAASLIGPQFATGLVAEALEVPTEQVDDICESLARRALFLNREDDEAWPDGRVQSRYGVTHALVQEVCFDRSSPARRARWHRLIAQHLDATYGARAAEIAHVLASHYEQGQVVERALHCYVTAAERTARRFSIEDASRLFRRGLALVNRLPESPGRDKIELAILGGISQSVTLSSDRTSHEPVALFERMITIARRLDEIPQLYAAMVNLYFRHGTLADYAKGDAVDLRLVALEQAHEIDPELRVFADGARGIVAMWKGDLVRGLALLEPITHEGNASGPMGGILGNADRIAFLLIYQCTMRWASGEVERALAEAERGIAQAIRVGDPYVLGASLCILARLHFFRRDEPQRILDAATRVLAIPEADVWYAQASILAGAARSQRAPLDAAEIEELHETFRSRTSTFPMGASALAVPMIEILRAGGQHARAAALVEEMIGFVADHAEYLFEPECLRLRGDLCASEDAYRAALDSAQRHGLPAFELRAALSLAQHTGAARDELAAALARITGTAPDVTEARRLLAG